MSNRCRFKGIYYLGVVKRTQGNPIIHSSGWCRWQENNMRTLSYCQTDFSIHWIRNISPIKSHIRIAIWQCRKKFWQAMHVKMCNTLSPGGVNDHHQCWFRQWLIIKDSRLTFKCRWPIRDQNVVIIVAAYVPAPNGARPAAATALTAMVEIFLPCLSLICCLWQT